MIDEAKQLARSWADFIDERYKAPRGTESLRTIQRNELFIAVMPETEGILRRAMAKLEFDLFVTTLVHHRETISAREKVRIIQRVSGEPMSTRDLWNKLDRVHHYLAGISFEREVAVHSPRVGKGLPHDSTR